MTCECLERTDTNGENSYSWREQIFGERVDTRGESRYS